MASTRPSMLEVVASTVTSRPSSRMVFEVMGPICPVGHVKDIRLRDGLVLHIDEEVPGAGELDMDTALRRWHQLYPDGYMLLEHLPAEKYTLASQTVHRIAAAAGIEIH